MIIIHRLLFSRISFFLLICGTVLGDFIPPSFELLKLKECLLPRDHPVYAKMEQLIQDPHMFESQHTFEGAGFQVINKMHRGLMVAKHPELKNFLIKKYRNKASQKQQLKNYIVRVSGAKALKDFIDLNHLQHIVVPQKWIYPLPKEFNDPETGKRTYFLVVEKINLYGDKTEIANRYAFIDFDTLQELCIVTYYFRGLESKLENMPFTNKNQIAFIDTEKWRKPRANDYLRRLMPYLREDAKQYALEIFHKLEAQEFQN